MSFAEISRLTYIHTNIIALVYGRPFVSKLVITTLCKKWVTSCDKLLSSRYELAHLAMNLIHHAITLIHCAMNCTHRTITALVEAKQCKIIAGHVAQ